MDDNPGGRATSRRRGLRALGRLVLREVEAISTVTCRSPSPSLSAMADPKVVLVVDDSVELVRLVELTLRPLGIETITVTANFQLKKLRHAIEWERVDVAI